jgi:hypothetical protein
MRRSLALLLVSITVLACGPAEPGDGSQAPSASASHAIDPWSGYPAGWTELPPPPEIRTGAAQEWTGSQLLIWGGYTGFDEPNVVASGLVFDPAESAWRQTAPGPLEPRALMASAWTGSEFLVWGGWSGTYGYEFAEAFFGDGAAYDPGSDSWRTLPPAPIDARAPLSVWTGQEMLVWGTSVRVEDRPRDGAAYEPTTDSWRRIAEAPIELTDATAVWTGSEMIVFGAALHGGNRPETPTAIGAAYDPATDQWRSIADSTLSPQASTAAWNGDEMIAWDYLNDSAAYEPVTDSWRSLPRIPLDESECTPKSEALEGNVLGDYCGGLTLFDPAQQRWVWLDRPASSGPPFWEYELISASSVFLLPAQRYGDATEIRFFAYRPGPVAGTTGGRSVEPTPFIPDGWIQGDVLHVPVTFPDGSSATLTYPAELGLASEGLQPDVSYIWNDDLASRHPVLFLHGPIGVEASYLEGEEPRATFELPAGGAAALWPAAGAESHRLRPIEWWLVYRTATWSVLASVRSERDAEVLAPALSVEEGESGLPFVATSGPVRLAQSFGEDEGPVLAIGDAAPDPSIVSDLDAVVFLSPRGCSGGPEFDDPPVVVSTCLGAGSVFANIYGDADFLRAILDGLRVESFSPVPT